jgi:hypothetical protein
VPLPGGINPRFEYWVGADGSLIMVPYAPPPPYGDFFDAEALGDVLAGR